MEDKKVIHNYALALYEISSNPVIISQLQVIANMFSKYHSIAALTGKSTVDTTEREAWIAKQLADFLPEVQKFIQVLDEKGRLNVVAKIAEEYETLVFQDNNVERIFITTATLAKADSLQKIADTFEKKVGHNLIIEHIIDPSIIGGVKVKIGSKLYDDTIKSKLNKVTNQIKKGV